MKLRDILKDEINQKIVSYSAAALLSLTILGKGISSLDEQLELLESSPKIKQYSTQKDYQTARAQWQEDLSEQDPLVPLFYLAFSPVLIPLAVNSVGAGICSIYKKVNKKKL